MPLTDFRGNKNYTPKGRRNQERTLKGLLDVSVRNGPTRDPTAWQQHDDDDDDYDDDDDEDDEDDDV